MKLQSLLAGFIFAAALLSLTAPWSSADARGYGGHSMGRVHLAHYASASTHSHARR